MVRKKVIATFSCSIVLRVPMFGRWKSWLADGNAIYPKLRVVW